MKKILYGVSGIGNGHANRELPIIEELSKSCQIMVFCHDDSQKVFTNNFSNNPNITIVPVGLTFVFGSPTGLDFAATANHPHNLDSEVFRTSYQALDAVIKKWGTVDLVISDYEPMSAQFAYAYQIPLVTIDQQSKFLYAKIPSQLGGFTYLDEVTRLHMFFPKVDTRIVCSFFNISPRENPDKILLVPPTIKKSIIDLKSRRRLDPSQINILVYISSAREFIQPPVEVISCLRSTPDVKYHLFVPPTELNSYSFESAPNIIVLPHSKREFLNALKIANGIISTAGHSLLSEAMYLGIPVLAIPVSPYEQHLNANVIDENGLGLMATKLTKKILDEFISNLEKYTVNIKNDTSILLRGTGQSKIIEYLKNKFLTPKKKVLIFSPPFDGHLNILKEFYIDNCESFDIRFVITGWKNIKPNLTGLDTKIVDLVEKSELKETDPALWTFPRVVESLEDCLKIAKEFLPDLIIYDFFSLEGNIVGRLLSIPHWASIPALLGPFNNQEYRDEKIKHSLNKKSLQIMKEKFDIDIAANEIEIVSDGFHLPGQLNLIWSFSEITPPNYDHGRSRNPLVFVGNPRGDNFEKIDYKNLKPLIYISFGTVIMNNLWNQQEDTKNKLREFISYLAEVWKSDNYQTIFVTQGKKILDEYPSNWWVYDSVDQVEILSRTDVFITHGGSNSFHEAIMQRVPMVVIPFFGDQLLVGRRVEELGIGICAGGSESIDTHTSKQFLNSTLAAKVVDSVDKIIRSPRFVKNYLYLNFKHSSLKSLILDEKQEVADDLPQANNHPVIDKLLKLPGNVVVTSESTHKLNAVRSALKEIFPKNTISIIGKNPKLNHPEQLVGIKEIISAAKERLVATANGLASTPDLLISMVSGIVPNGHLYSDVGVVLIKTADGRTSTVKTAPLNFPLTAVQKAKLRGYKNFTIGKIIGEELADHRIDTDPHSYLTKGKQSRSELFKNAILLALMRL